MKSVRLLLPLGALLLVGCRTENVPLPANVADIHRHISSTWESTIRFNPVDDSTLIGLPHPYTVPCPGEMFQEMYYWDTFFTNEGLILDGRTDMAKNNVDNLLYMVERFGFVPNGSRTWYLNRSQPPYLSHMVNAVYEATGDREWLEKAYDTLLKEYEFWQTERTTCCGLNSYGGTGSRKLLDEFYVTGNRRIGMEPDEELWEGFRDSIAFNFIAEAESGWDFNPRFERNCQCYCPLDLNANLYGYEMNFARFSKILKRGTERYWKGAAKKRADLIRRYCKSPENGYFYDYNFRTGKRSPVLSAAVFSLMFNKVLTKKEARALKYCLPALECPYGIAVCEDGDYAPYNYQWSWPNAWPPTNYLTVAGLRNYGFDRDASRIAGECLDAYSASFGKTGKLWEKYNAIDIDAEAASEYGTPEMLGWSAGTFIYFENYLKN